MMEGKEDLCEKERLIKGRVDFVDTFGGIYVNGRSLHPIVRTGDYIIVYRLREKGSQGGGKVVAEDMGSL